MTREDTTEAPPEWVLGWLSPARLAPYIAASGSPTALQLYKQNSTLSAAFFELVGWFEIAWRNTVDRAITSQRPAEAQHWLFDPAFPLQPATRAKARQAIRAVQRNGIHEPKPGRVIAELTLGFWRFTTKGYRNTIWAPYLKKAFPYAHPRPQHWNLDIRLLAIIRERNRVAHHEPVFNHPAELQARVRDILEIGSWINPQAAQWWQENMSKVLAVS